MFILKLQDYSATVINELNLRQNILIKNSIRLSKYVRKTLFFTALRMKSIQHLVYQHKLSFVNQLNSLDLIKQIYEYLNNFFRFENAQTDSFFKSIKIKLGT
jgi:hypothetical protein